jgi:hypothetical protein
VFAPVGRFEIFNPPRLTQATDGVIGNFLVQSNNKISITAALAVFAFYYSYLLLFRTPLSLLGDPDTFWHISTGQWILDHARFPTVDFFSFTAYGKPWISTEWLSEILFATAYKFGGWRAVTVLSATAYAATAAILCFYLLRHLRFSVAIGWTALTVTAISLHFLARPHIFSFVLIVIWTINLLNAYDDEDFSLPSVFSLAPLMILWANLHGSFTFGLLLLYIFAACCFYQRVIRRADLEWWRPVAIVSVITICAMITPYGFRPALMTFAVLNLKFTIQHIDELQPLDFQKHLLLLMYFVAILMVIAGLGIRLRAARLIMFGLITFVGLSYSRALIMYFLLVPIVLARPLAGCFQYFAPQFPGMKEFEVDKTPDPVLNFLQKRSRAVLACCLTLAFLITASTWWRKDIMPPSSIAPKAAIDFVRGANITGNVFNGYGFGGYLIFRGIPTFIDGRALPFGDDFLHKYFDTINLVDISAAFGVLDEYKVNWIILQPDEPLAKALAQSVLWNQVFSDKDSVVFVRRRQTSENG